MSASLLNVIAAVHIVVCLLLICLVLLQDPKGGAAGGIFGGGSNSLLGATGATTFLTKLTRFAAIGFGALCLLMVWLLKQNSGSILDKVELPAAATTPPAATATASPGETAGAGATAPAATPAQQTPAAPAADKK